MTLKIWHHQDCLSPGLCCWRMLQILELTCFFCAICPDNFSCFWWQNEGTSQFLIFSVNGWIDRCAVPNNKSRFTRLHFVLSCSLYYWRSGVTSRKKCTHIHCIGYIRRLVMQSALKVSRGGNVYFLLQSLCLTEFVFFLSITFV